MMNINLTLLKAVRWDECKTCLAHLMGGSWVLFFCTLMKYLIQFVGGFFHDEYWRNSFKHIDEIENVVMVILFAVVCLTTLVEFGKRALRDGK